MNTIINFDTHRSRSISLPAEQSSASQNGFCSMELIMFAIGVAFVLQHNN